MNRRKFIRNTLGLAAASYILPSVQLGVKKRGQKITILHTNDTHSRIDPFPTDDARYANLGGVSKRMNLIDKIRNEEEHVLLLDAGDIFQGTPYFNLYGGELELKLMTAMKYDAATMGNHDFDGGLEGFHRVLPLADFPFLCANYNFENTILRGKTKPYHIFQKGNIKVGVFGIGVELKGLVPDVLFGETVYENPIEKAQHFANILRIDEKCDLVICLSHLGYKPKQNDYSDLRLASETDNIHLIIGGHTHTFLDKAEEHKNKSGKKVLINQAGWAGIVLGRIDFYFDEKNNLEEWAGNALSHNSLIS